MDNVTKQRSEEVEEQERKEGAHRAKSHWPVAGGIQVQGQCGAMVMFIIDHGEVINVNKYHNKKLYENQNCGTMC